ncbi:ATP-dependent sacrificial sulfur transferase LarE [Weissella coleopterorum]|uniref:ATP-dependent sacrificial sulfur transferase LarE n=1 Tax=Weissella coleopterorum TaxID=2714949 RepID=A0A6G8B1X1_9LACO|nr:ATP-dependent sacrificial sulfur transferase LarE [Weissella coleopterorum]QIL51133.1 ATP-dependent sacrificial sulfur transferase LarE [Weissella coleopterorum]
MNILDKQNQVISMLKESKKVLVAFSGGIDSTLVLKLAVDTLGTQNVKAVVANSVLFTQVEFDQAVGLGKTMGVEVIQTEIDYLTNESIKYNKPTSWYWMKKLFYQRLNEIAKEEQVDAVLDGMIMDDQQDFRPGLRARDEEGAISLLQAADFYKSDVRNLATQLGLKNWNKVASCSVSSRFPYNTELTVVAIERLKQAEAFLRSLGFATVRVRVQDLTARIEVPLTQVNELIQQAGQINAQLKEYGYQFVTVDLQGFKSGRMNDQLSNEVKNALVD